jgi:phosphatidylserine/phosphatidylglycerophosphate/cardiolipin synthase-like enzyme
MPEALRGLAPEDLRALDAAVRSGRLWAPFTAAAVRTYCPGSAADEAAAALQQLADEGIRPEHLSHLLQALADARSGPRGLDEGIDLVWTGPDIPGLVSRDTSVVVRELFSAAERSVLVAGYAVYQGRDVFRALAERMEAVPDLQVRMFLDIQRPYPDTTRNADLVRRFASRFRSLEWSGTRFPEVYYDPRSLHVDRAVRASLHAKCVVIDERVAFVSSANFTPAAQVKNVEAGVLVRSERFAKQLAGHFHALVSGNALLRVPGL